MIVKVSVFVNCDIFRVINFRLKKRPNCLVRTSTVDSDYTFEIEMVTKKRILKLVLLTIIHFVIVICQVRGLASGCDKCIA